MAKRNRYYRPDEPLRHPNHRRPVSRRDFISQGFRAGTASVLGISGLSLLSMSQANALDANLSDYFRLTQCDMGYAEDSGPKIPVICFDLAGGANIAGSNVLVGGPGGQLDSLNTAGYTKLGVPPDSMPDTSTNNFIDNSLGLLFHSDSAMLRGILRRAPGVVGNVNGAVIPARSDNDTGNNPHNPMYGLYQAGLRGQVLQLIGSNASMSGGNSMAPALWIDPEIRPTKIDRPSDARGLVDVGDLGQLLTNVNDIVSVMETVKRISDFKLNLADTTLTPSDDDRRLKERLSCEYKRAADTFQNYPDADALDPGRDPEIAGDTGIFNDAEFNNSNDSREFQKTASVMKLVIGNRNAGTAGARATVGSLAGAGTITMGGYDYHTGERQTGEDRDYRAGQCIGACLEYARRMQKPLMIYVFSDGSVFSNGMTETVSVAGSNFEKGVWTGDNSQTAASFFLVYDPISQPELLDEGPSDPLLHQQIGWMRPDASVETSATPAANNVNLLVQTMILNYAALHGQGGVAFDSYFPTHGLGGVDARRRYIAFKKLASVDDSGFIIVPPA